MRRLRFAIAAAAVLGALAARFYRHGAIENGVSAGGLSGWAPSFCAAVGAPAVVALWLGSRRLTRRARWRALVEVQGGLLLYEIVQLAPIVGQRFDLADVMATLVGAPVGLAIEYLIETREGRARV